MSNLLSRSCKAITLCRDTLVQMDSETTVFLLLSKIRFFHDIIFIVRIRFHSRAQGQPYSSLVARMQSDQMYWWHDSK